jgi:hypothetical protein
VPFTNPFPAPLLYALCRGEIGTSLSGGETPDGGAGRSVFNCDLPAKDYNVSDISKTDPIGLKVTIRVDITPACPALLPEGFSPLTAIYSLHLPTNDAIPVNQNPELDGIFATQNWTGTLDGGGAGTDNGSNDGGVVSDDGGGLAVADGGGSGADASQGHDGPDGSIALDDEAGVVVARDKHVGLQLDMDISTAEHLAVPSTVDFDSVHNLTRHYEHLDIAWYAEAGSFTGRGKGENTGYLPTGLPPGQDTPPSAVDNANFAFNTTNTWDLPKTQDYPYTTARIIVVVRDGRGGVDWSSRLVTLP